jgi:hypothetical protein
LRNRVIEIGRIEDVAGVERLETFSGEPRAQHLDDACAQRPRFHHAAVEEHVGRAGKAARPSPDAGRRTGAGRLNAQEAREVPGYGRIGCIRQPDFLQADAPLPRGHRIARDHREKPVQQRGIHIGCRQRGRDGAADQP